MKYNITELLIDLQNKNRKSIAKSISLIENDQKIARKLIKKIYKNTSSSLIIGITGPAGAGKSSLINIISLELQKLGKNPAILAIDPTSHLSGGAVLGDRIRMNELTNSGVYIRSIASRGATGAISHSIHNIIRILEYADFDPIIIESVGAGQTEIEISNVADIAVVVFNPNTGDNIQTIKAGITEIGDIYVVNKSDLNGSLQLYRSIQDYIGESKIVLLTSTKTKKGIGKLVKTLQNLLDTKNKLKRSNSKSKIKYELRDIVLNNIKEKVDMELKSNRTLSYLEQIELKKINIFEAADKISNLLMK
ncbi:MAG: methylmalonyl Co-A mutase-associated GTPase MeaB [Nitrosopumilaceae archaeon]|nr:methylmalonyl Co-A mutase-associated GTPase MeaB [Nitrosopumilaceae archaeon]